MSAPRPEDQKGRVLPFRQRKKPRADGSVPTPVEGLEKFTEDDAPDDYRQRMTNNVLALAFCLLLVAIGIWLVNSMADLRKKQDCVLSGRRDCANIAAPAADPK
jgi:hypothetical protein